VGLIVAAVAVDPLESTGLAISEGDNPLVVQDYSPYPHHS
jgi:hypothetical protein